MRLARTFLVAILTWTTTLPLANFLLPSQTAAAAEVADLQDQLEAGLKARRPVEFQFIARVVLLVRQDRLPVGRVRTAQHPGVAAARPLAAKRRG